MKFQAIAEKTANKSKVLFDAPCMSCLPNILILSINSELQIALCCHISNTFCVQWTCAVSRDQSMWAERSGKISPSSLNPIYGSPTHNLFDFLSRSAPALVRSKAGFKKGGGQGPISAHEERASHYTCWCFSFIAGTVGTCVILTFLSEYW